MLAAVKSSVKALTHAMLAYLIPSHWLCPEEGTGQLHRKPLLVILWLVFRHSE